MSTLSEFKYSEEANEKAKQGIAGYEPTVEVSTKKDGNNVLVRVKDNGNGIPQKILDKIFQHAAW